MNMNGSRALAPKPPDKGSFPLDHFGGCKSEADAFMACMKANGHVHYKCKPLSSTYLECRMAKWVLLCGELRAFCRPPPDPCSAEHPRNLMAKEDLTTLGFSEEAMSWEPAVAQAPVPEAVMKQEKGFIAGRLWPMLRSCARPQTHLGHPLAFFLSPRSFTKT